ncbi:hypothetical protein CBR_g525 [Chara braunii]|uniref:rRNA-processing protein EFG1 n=1 Tax=Chara braunii TaxID=69332 RepID=A0A388KBF5_CHABU|nr:hypothetical protein CBR_g525 [Chara braunii]|eukprot:GBG67388.1 hypothetical protein CBR_g525 [Chara braunii]
MRFAMTDQSPPHEIKVAMEKKLAELKEQLAARARNVLEQKMTLRYKRVKFLERREIERRMRRVEKQQRMLAERGEDKGEAAAELAKQMSQLKLDMEYVRFFPKSEKYVSLFKGDDSEHVVARRQALREMIRANLAAAAAEGVDLEKPKAMIKLRSAKEQSSVHYSKRNEDTSHLEKNGFNYARISTVPLVRQMCCVFRLIFPE